MQLKGTIIFFNFRNDCERWLDVVTSVTVEGNERIYAQWGENFCFPFSFFLQMSKFRFISI